MIFCLLIVPTSAAMATPSSDSSVSNGLYVPTGLANGDVKPVISSTPLADFLMQLEDYTPTVSYYVTKTTVLEFILFFCLLYCLFLSYRFQMQLRDIISIEQDLKHQIQECKFANW